jgi:hypothetical protein
MAAVAMLTGCMKEEAQTSSEKTSKISVEIAETATKTYVEGEKIYWHETGEQLNIIYFADDNSYSRWGIYYEAINYANLVIEYAPLVVDRDPDFTEGDLEVVPLYAYG